ncbi:hypothetical protein B5F34_16085 [Mediterranea sp. An20]|nr:hypothetical protein B5F34_16085 [Mediterranea sp. An20]
MMKYIFFYFPLWYLVKSRLYTIYKFLSWLVVYLIPVFLLFIWNSGFSMLNICVFVLTVFLIYNYYEIGYIQNDTETIKKENIPTLRLKKDEYSYYERHKIYIYISRLCIGIVFLFLFKEYISMEFIFFLFLILICYLIYNSIRNRWNLLINSCLVLIRYLSPLFMCVGTENYIILFASVFIYPLLNFIERASSKRFNLYSLQRIVGNLTTFRIKYYSFFTLLYAFLSYFLGEDYLKICLLFSFLLIFRLLIYWGVKLGIAPSNYLKA